MRVGLISCSAGKLDHRAPAAELYTGPIFRAARAWITNRGELGAWAILSAKHGLVLPDQELDPYDVSLSSLSFPELKAWGERTQAQLVARWGRDAIYTVLAGSDYRQATRGLPYVEDVIGCWTRRRREDGIRPAAVGIGVLKKYLKEQRGLC